MIEFERRVEARLAEWNERYAADGMTSASPLLDRILAEGEVGAEMAAEGSCHHGIREPEICAECAPYTAADADPSLVRRPEIS